jgi:hypothetical protein
LRVFNFFFFRRVLLSIFLKLWFVATSSETPKNRLKKLNWDWDEWNWYCKIDGVFDREKINLMGFEKWKSITHTSERVKRRSQIINKKKFSTIFTPPIAKNKQEKKSLLLINSLISSLINNLVLSNRYLVEFQRKQKENFSTLFFPTIIQKSGKNRKKYTLKLKGKSTTTNNFHMISRVWLAKIVCVFNFFSSFPVLSLSLSLYSYDDMSLVLYEWNVLFWFSTCRSFFYHHVSWIDTCWSPLYTLNLYFYSKQMFKFAIIAGKLLMTMKEWEEITFFENKIQYKISLQRLIKLWRCKKF